MMAYFQTEEQAMGGLARLRWSLHPESGMAVETRCIRNATLLDCCLGMPRGKRETKGGQRAIRRALWVLREKGVHRVAAAPELEGALLETRLQPTQEKPLWRACSGQAALALLAKRGLRPEQTWLCLKTPRVDRDVLRCARLLARRVRYLTVRAPVGGEALAEELYEEYGIALQQSVPPEYSQLCLCLAGDPAEEGIIPWMAGPMAVCWPWRRNGPGNRSPLGWRIPCMGRFCCKVGCSGRKRSGWSLQKPRLTQREKGHIMINIIWNSAPLGAKGRKSWQNNSC